MKNLKAFVRKPCGSRAADHSKSRKFFWKVQSFALVAILAGVAGTPLVSGCGGGGSAITLAIAPSTTQTLDQGQSVTFYAQLGNDNSNKGVAWQPLTGTGCAGTGCGTLTNVTTTSVTYTAPTGLTSAITVSLEAISNAEQRRYQDGDDFGGAAADIPDHGADAAHQRREWHTLQPDDHGDERRSSADISDHSG